MAYVTCDKCGQTYNDELRWTICPHNRLEVLHDTPYYNCGNPGTSQGHDLYNCTLTNPTKEQAMSRDDTPRRDIVAGSVKQTRRRPWTQLALDEQNEIRHQYNEPALNPDDSYFKPRTWAKGDNGKWTEKLDPPLGQRVAPEHVVSRTVEHEDCQRELMAAKRAYPRTCAGCGLYGPCRYGHGNNGGSGDELYDEQGKPKIPPRGKEYPGAGQDNEVWRRHLQAEANRTGEYGVIHEGTCHWFCDAEAAGAFTHTFGPGYVMDAITPQTTRPGGDSRPEGEYPIRSTSDGNAPPVPGVPDEAVQAKLREMMADKDFGTYHGVQPFAGGPTYTVEKVGMDLGPQNPITMVQVEPSGLHTINLDPQDNNLGPPNQSQQDLRQGWAIFLTGNVLARLKPRVSNDDYSTAVAQLIDMAGMYERMQAAQQTEAAETSLDLVLKELLSSPLSDSRRFGDLKEYANKAQAVLKQLREERTHDKAWMAVAQEANQYLTSYLLKIHPDLNKGGMPVDEVRQVVEMLLERVGMYQQAEQRERHNRESAEADRKAIEQQVSNFIQDFRAEKFGYTSAFNEAVQKLEVGVFGSSRALPTNAIKDLVTGLRGEIEAQRRALDEAKGYLGRMLKHLHPTIQLMPDLMGLCTQIDNVLAGYKDASPISPTLVNLATQVVETFYAAADWTDRARQLTHDIDKLKEVLPQQIVGPKLAMLPMQEPPPDFEPDADVENYKQLMSQVIFVLEGLDDLAGNRSLVSAADKAVLGRLREIRVQVEKVQSLVSQDFAKIKEEARHLQKQMDDDSSAEAQRAYIDNAAMHMMPWLMKEFTTQILTPNLDPNAPPMRGDPQFEPGKAAAVAFTAANFLYLLRDSMNSGAPLDIPGIVDRMRQALGGGKR